jgi:hypothetical protein
MGLAFGVRIMLLAQQCQDRCVGQRRKRNRRSLTLVLIISAGQAKFSNDPVLVRYLEVLSRD